MTSRISEQINHLRTPLAQHHYSYYVLATPSIPDAAYDLLLRTISELDTNQ
ncbi:hypothetical protein, partial [Pseudoalteromonas sp. S3173]|uniref:hypothetical protein n=1 Tax=Pseudoalteromonas sp. S3173 TaxID=579531 RepID=UPI00110CB3B6